MSRINVVSIFAALSILLLSVSLQAQQSPDPQQVSPKDSQPGSSTLAKAKKIKSLTELEESSRQAYEDKKYVQYFSC